MNLVKTQSFAKYRKVSMNVKNKIVIKKQPIPIMSLVLSVFIFLFSAISVASAADLKGIKYTKLPGDKVQINLETSGDFDEPGVFNTSEPARLAFDFFGMKKGDVESLLKVGIGSVDSIVTVATDDRTRVVVNLIENAKFNTEKIANGFVINVGNGIEKTSTATSSKPKPFAKQPELVSSKSIEKIDFRRSKNGGGKVIVNLSDPSTSIDVSEQAGEIVIDFQGAKISSDLEKRLDVTDFATPVDSIDSFQSGENVRLILIPNGEYRQISYQNGKEFTVIVDPFVETEEERAARENETGFNGERLSINFQRIQVRAALAVIADFTGINIVASDEVEGELTLNLKDVPWDQALDVILETKGLSKRQTGDVIWIAPAARVAELKKAQAEAAAASAELEPLVSEVIQINYARATDLRDVLLGEEDNSGGGGQSNDDTQNTVILDEGEGGSGSQNAKDGKSGLIITADERSNSLLVTTTRENLKGIKALINKLDKPLRQVMVETRIVEASDTFSRELGARLGFQRVTENTSGFGSGTNLGTTISGATVGGNDVVGNSLVDDGPLQFAQGGPGLNVDLSANPIGLESAASYAFQLFRAGTGFANILNLELSALEANGDGKIVASPRLVAANNTEARISQGQIVIFERANSDGETLEREALLELVVTPQITPDDRVILDVEITQDSFESATVINTKRIETQILVENGETIIIGGIFQEQEVNQITKVPFLGDLPYLGNAFKKKSKLKDRTELLIFLTPKLINDALRLG